MTQQTDLVFLKQAELIGDKICRNAYWFDDQCYWQDHFTDREGSKRVVVRRPLGLDIYFGASGVALFLAALYSVAPKELYRTTAEGSANLTRTLVEDLDPRFPIGFYIGYVGIAYSLMELGEVFSNEQLITSARELIRRISQRDIAAQGIDIISGAAGAITPLLMMYRKYSDESVLNLAVEYGDHLIARATKSDQGLSWSGGGDNTSLTLSQIGFAHGDAGMGWALLELSAVTGAKRFLIAAEEAFRHQQTWVDLLRRGLQEADNIREVSQALSWCNGAVGVCLSRLRAYELTKNQIYKDEAEDALSTAIRSADHDTSIQNYSVCHGIAGTADLLIYASQTLSDVAYKAAANQKGLKGIEEIEQKSLPWPCGSSQLGETLNLMSGLAGIGYFYLRLYDPDKTPPLTMILPKRII